MDGQIGPVIEQSLLDLAGKDADASERAQRCVVNPIARRRNVNQLDVLIRIDRFQSTGHPIRLP
jgi:hypothetical protein